MNEQQYLELCKECDRVLMAPDSTVERVAIPWLHVIREHPVFLVNYEDLFEDGAGIGRFLRHWVGTMRNKAQLFQQVLRTMQTSGAAWFGPAKLPEQVDFLFVSHLLNTSQAGKYEDFYFGELASHLASEGYSVLIALINHSGESGETLAEKWRDSEVSRVVFSRSLDLATERKFYLKQQQESRRLKKLAKGMSGLSYEVAMRASQEAVSGGSRDTLRLAKQIASLVSKVQPKALLLTHEGHAWERVAFAVAREAKPDVKCLGYQHAALFRLQHAIRRCLFNEFNPDHILTAGLVSKGQLEKSSSLPGVRISVLGSNRSFKSDKFNKDYRQYTEMVDMKKAPACLVIPEGIVDECNILFEFSLACAHACPEIQFVWRLHPLISFESLLAKNPRLQNIPKNIIKSKNTFEEDMASCRWTLYRGTTAVVQAVVAGLQPIYLKIPNEMTIDPLYEIDEWRVSVSTVSEIMDVIMGDDSTKHQNKTEQCSRLYCESFFVPFNYNTLTSLLKFNNADS